MSNDIWKMTCSNDLPNLILHFAYSVLLVPIYVIDHPAFVVCEQEAISKFEDVAGSAVDDAVL